VLKTSPGSERKFTADDFVLGAGVAGDVDVLEVALDAFLEVERHVDRVVRAGRGDGARLEVDVAARPVGVLDRFDVRADTLR